MAQQTPSGITYPEAGDHTRIWEHMQTLAESVETATSNLGTDYAEVSPSSAESPGVSNSDWEDFPGINMTVRFPRATTILATFHCGWRLSDGNDNYLQFVAEGAEWSTRARLRMNMAAMTHIPATMVVVARCPADTDVIVKPQARGVNAARASYLWTPDIVVVPLTLMADSS